MGAGDAAVVGAAHGAVRRPVPGLGHRDPRRRGRPGRAGRAPPGAPHHRLAALPARSVLRRGGAARRHQGRAPAALRRGQGARLNEGWHQAGDAQGQGHPQQVPGGHRGAPRGRAGRRRRGRAEGVGGREHNIIPRGQWRRRPAFKTLEQYAGEKQRGADRDAQGEGGAVEALHGGHRRHRAAHPRRARGGAGRLHGVHLGEQLPLPGEYRDLAEHRAAAHGLQPVDGLRVPGQRAAHGQGPQPVAAARRGQQRPRPAGVVPRHLQRRGVPPARALLVARGHPEPLRQRQQARGHLPDARRGAGHEQRTLQPRHEPRGRGGADLRGAGAHAGGSLHAVRGAAHLGRAHRREHRRARQRRHGGGARQVRDAQVPHLLRDGAAVPDLEGQVRHAGHRDQHHFGVAVLRRGRLGRVGHLHGAPTQRGQAAHVAVAGAVQRRGPGEPELLPAVARLPGAHHRPALHDAREAGGLSGDLRRADEQGEGAPHGGGQAQGPHQHSQGRGAAGANSSDPPEPWELRELRRGGRSAG
mmetsp:Transcript_25500/g.79844  ORF Transcript_25500/g.79844 Transcript_25500/m.79844 type:complete len:528 (+) Transcript_25500:642-2225(+)